MSFIEVKNLKKRYTIYKGKFFNRKKITIEALKGIDLTIKKGTFIGYIGPNGAGKSTTIKLLTGILTPDEGTIKVNGYNPSDNRKEYVRNIGVVFGQKTQMWWDLPVIDTYKLYKSIYKVSDKDYNKQLDYLVNKLNLSEILHQPVRQLSLGQRMRCELGACMIHNPDILFLDEPTIGLDIVSKHKVMEFLKELNQNGKTIFLTTHDLKDIETLCNEILILNHGGIVYNGDIQNLKRITKMPVLLKAIVYKSTLKEEELLNIINDNNWIYNKNKDEVIVKIENVEKIGEVSKTLLNAIPIESFIIEEPNIEEIIKQIYMS